VDLPIENGDLPIENGNKLISEYIGILRTHIPKDSKRTKATKI
jgi:hypothetical protein